MVGVGVGVGGVYLALDDVIILVDLQVVAGVAGDGAAVPVVEVAPGAAASELCIADERLLAVDGFARVVHAATGGCAWRGQRRKIKSRRERDREREKGWGESQTIRENNTKPQLKSTTDHNRLAIHPSSHPSMTALHITSIKQKQRGAEDRLRLSSAEGWRLLSKASAQGERGGAAGRVISGITFITSFFSSNSLISSISAAHTISDFAKFFNKR